MRTEVVDADNQSESNDNNPLSSIVSGGAYILLCFFCVKSKNTHIYEPDTFKLSSCRVFDDLEIIY